MILGISAFYHDSAACIIKDGKITVHKGAPTDLNLKEDVEDGEPVIDA